MICMEYRLQKNNEGKITDKFVGVASQDVCNSATSVSCLIVYHFEDTASGSLVIVPGLCDNTRAHRDDEGKTCIDVKMIENSGLKEAIKRKFEGREVRLNTAFA